jgi:hypothetical protein
MSVWSRVSSVKRVSTRERAGRGKGAMSVCLVAGMQVVVSLLERALARGTGCIVCLVVGMHVVVSLAEAPTHTYTPGGGPRGAHAGGPGGAWPGLGGATPAQHAACNVQRAVREVKRGPGCGRGVSEGRPLCLAASGVPMRVQRSRTDTGSVSNGGDVVGTPGRALLP